MRRAASLLVVFLLFVSLSPASLASETHFSSSRMFTAQEAAFGSGETVEQARSQSTPNTRRTVSSLSSEGVQGIEVAANRCAVVLERAADTQFSLALAGEQAENSVAAEMTVKNGRLLVEAAGSQAVSYISSLEDFLVNAVVLYVPEGRYSSISLEGEDMLFRLCELNAPVNGKGENGSILIRDSTIVSPCTLNLGNGIAAVAGGDIEAKVDLSAQNGSLHLTGDAVSGRVSMQIENGTAELTADSLGRATLLCENGRLQLDAGILTGDVLAKTHNGQADVTLRGTPQNLTFRAPLQNSRIQLPADWQDGVQFGSGTPTLTLVCKNGDVRLEPK